MTGLVIPDAGTIGSASDTDAISIASTGKATFSAGIANTGTIDAGSIGNAVTMSANQACVKTALNAGGSTPVYACRTWVNFDGTGIVGIRSSGNVSSVTDNGTGNYTINFTTAMPDANYSAVQYCNSTSGTGADDFNNGFIGGMGDKSTSSITVRSYHTSALADSSMYDIIIMR